MNKITLDTVRELVEEERGTIGLLVLTEHCAREGISPEMLQQALGCLMVSGELRVVQSGAIGAVVVAMPDFSENELLTGECRELAFA